MDALSLTVKRAEESGVLSVTRDKNGELQ
jgi:hypothetical protein